ncbi:interferon-related developmental regulator-domain-containing protein [Durotheca rogersii]|uniref:interferon-related developmental regulator-domain-containing protein n=1 Tax=Durotheca rogersii TaxID=419775 RepID=UPI00222125AB|nr:interferon-related developmental regulator-domain-containing protein [Durotheca rogersii]KAI5861138.1 interferon-related developmental regulator-domain-containing protein [Durotheca rogersii]
MHDLRKKVFESNKTISRKARSRQQSGQGSPASSRAGSRAPSLQPSDDEHSSDTDWDDGLTVSVANSEYSDDTPPASRSEALHNHIVDLLDQKRSSVQDREVKLAAYAHMLRHHPNAAVDEINQQINDLIPLFLKAARGFITSLETVNAIKALTVTILSTELETAYGRVYPTLKGICQDLDDESVKVAAIRAMSVATMCGGGGTAEAEELMEFLLDIVETDGHVIEAGDSGPVVAAALDAWGFVASNIDDLEEESTRALEAFSEQLNSTDVDVQVAAGSNIALLLEAARVYEDETGEAWNMRYDQDQLLSQLAALTKESSKSISKKDRRHLHTSFNSVITSLQHGKGPGYSTARRLATNPHTGGNKTDFRADFQEYGYREKLRIQNITILIDTWSLSARVRMLKSVLGSGLANHYTDNQVVKGLLSGAHAEYTQSSAQKKNRGDKSSEGGKRPSRGKGGF